MAMSEAKKKANKKWNDANLKERYDRLQMVVPKGEKEVIAAAAGKCGESVNAYIYNAVRERMRRDAIEGGAVMGYSAPAENDIL